MTDCVRADGKGGRGVEVTSLQIAKITSSFMSPDTLDRIICFQQLSQCHNLRALHALIQERTMGIWCCVLSRSANG